MKRDKRLCYLCGRYVLPSDALRDHLVPKSVGGSDSLSNLALAHKGLQRRPGGDSGKRYGQAREAAATAGPRPGVI